MCRVLLGRRRLECDSASATMEVAEEGVMPQLLLGETSSKEGTQLRSF